MNKSGLQPVDYRVLVKIHETEKVSEGGIVLHVGQESERQQWAETKATLIAVGAFAFEEKGTPWPDAPKVGDTVLVRQYAGFKYKGNDEVQYQLCNDKDIMAIVRQS